MSEPPRRRRSGLCNTVGVISIDRPRLEGSVAVGADRKRRIGFSEFGSHRGRTILWLHGTPGARRQIPTEAREYADARGLRLIGLDRPGVGSSTAHRYSHIADFAEDVSTVTETLGIDEFAVIGVSGGAPYALGLAARLPGRVKVVGIVGGVAPVSGPDAAPPGGAVSLLKPVVPMLDHAGAPIGKLVSSVLSVARPIADPAISAYGLLSPGPDRQLLQRPEFRAMFLDDLLHGGSRRMEAPFADLILFVRDWGFRIADVKTPVRWWHGDADNIIPFEHGRHTVDLLPDAALYTLSGQSHLSGFGMSVQVIDEILRVWNRESTDPAHSVG